MIMQLVQDVRSSFKTHTDTPWHCFFFFCFPLPPVSRRLARVWWWEQEHPHTILTVWLVSRRFSTLTLAVCKAANVLEWWLTEDEMIMWPGSFAFPHCFLADCPDRPHKLGPNCTSFVYSHSQVKHYKWLRNHFYLTDHSCYGWCGLCISLVDIV